uniref:Uncharacterized protein n=1 Tax=Meloidogyne enterolobii TaxID=390850 RepID=A0A6V7V055_MELEN|nr:unnamed protein product [Meloidogyne enterolobii]
MTKINSIIFLIFLIINFMNYYIMAGTRPTNPGHSPGAGHDAPNVAAHGAHGHGPGK